MKQFLSDLLSGLFLAFFSLGFMTGAIFYRLWMMGYL